MLRLIKIVELLIAFACIHSTVFALSVRDVAIYDDRSWSDGGAWYYSIYGIREVLENKGYTWESIDANDVNNNDLGQYYKLIIFPGGWAGGYNEYINGSGYQNIRNFIDQGGAYLGMCAGSFFACDKVFWREGSDEELTPQNTYDYPLNLWNGIGDGVIRDFVYWAEDTYYADHPGTRMTDLKIDTNLMPESDAQMSVLYFGGPVFRPVAGKWGSTEVIARYEMDGYSADECAAMILFPYGSGRVFLSAVHPEVSLYAYTDNRGRRRSWVDYNQYNSFNPTTIQAQNFLGQIIDRLLTPVEEIELAIKKSKLLRFQTVQGTVYQIQSSVDAINWIDYGAPITAERFEHIISIPAEEAVANYRIQIVN